MSALLRTSVEARPDGPALIDDVGATSWSELDRDVNRLVHLLRERGLAEGDAVAVLAGNQAETFVAALACMHGGWVEVPVNWHWVASELAYVLVDSGARAVVVGGPWAATAAAAVAAVRADGARSPDVLLAVTDDPLDGFESFRAALDGASDAEPADQVRGGPMFYTSGTTGFPKGVRSTLSQTGDVPEIWQLVAAVIAQVLVPPPSDQVQLLCGPAYHSAQWVSSIAPIVHGAPVVLQHRFDAAGVLELIDRHQVTNTHLVPAQMVRLLRLPDDVRARFSGASLHQVAHGAAPCPPEVKRALIDWWGPVITEYYGGTEGGFISAITAEEWLTHPLSVGRPLPTVEIQVVDPEGRALGPGESGDLYFRSVSGSDFSYHNAPEKTEAAHLQPGVGTLGDVGHLDADGYLYLTDRRIDMVISGGVNIYPAEIEGAIAAHPAVADVAVFGIPDDEMGESVSAVVELIDGGAGTDELRAELEVHVRDRLAGYKCPRSWTFTDRLPRNEAGKLTKRVLRDPYWAGDARRI